MIPAAHSPIISRVARVWVTLLMVLALGACTSGEGGGAGASGTSKPQSLPAPLPSVTLQPLSSGKAVDLATLRGPLVINLWASNCVPCRTELPIYQKFARTHAGQVDVLGIDYRDPQSGAAVELAEQSGVGYRLLTDPDAAIAGKGPFPVLRGLPFLALVDAQGQVVHREYVEITSLGQLEDLVAEHLGVTR
ncbi:MAG: TlpA disulfide reductase family protein [Nocardioides sp.]|uniref:TlpA family protein disulfide reductase n=1 Tax=Nocardioides sp. TaxID=35761 RepID=UPI0039E5D5D1